MEYTVASLGERALLITLGNEINEELHQQVVSLLEKLEQERIAGVVEYVPAYCSIVVHYDPVAIWTYQQRVEHQPAILPSQWLIGKLEAIIKQCSYEPKVRIQANRRIVEIPICYGGEFGPDLKEVARYNDLSVEEVIKIHSQPTYLVHMLGFAPGFPYLGGMNPAIVMPRKAIPRAVIEAGSVGIAGGQTGIYPIRTPGGWRIIGRTPLKLFHPEYEVPTLIKPGDRIKFIPITEQQFNSIGELHWT